MPSTYRPPGHRARWQAGILVMLLLLVAGCSAGGGDTGTGSQRIELTFWSWVPTFTTAVELFNKAHPNIHVTYTSIAGPPDAYAKIRAAVQAGNAPDIATIEYHEIPAFAINGDLVPLGEHGAAQYQQRYSPWQWEQGVLGDQIYGIPQGAGPLGFFYRADLFAQAGITAPPKTWDEYEAAGRKLHQALPNSYIGTFDPTGPALFIGLAQQRRAPWFQPSGDAWKVTIDNPETRQVATFWNKLVTDKVVNVGPQNGTGYVTNLQNGTVAGWVCAQWCNSIIKTEAPALSGKWAVAPLPQWNAGEEFSGNWGGVDWSVLKGSKHPKEAVEFAAWMTSNPEGIKSLVDNGGGWPASLDAQKAIGAPDPYFSNQDINAIFSASDEHVVKDWKWNPTIDQTMAHLTDGLQAAAGGRGTFEDVLSSVQTQTVADMKGKGLKVMDK